MDEMNLRQWSDYVAENWREARKKAIKRLSAT